MQRRIAVEERKILIAQRKLETIRLLSELFARIKVLILLLYHRVLYCLHIFWADFGFICYYFYFLSIHLCLSVCCCVFHMFFSL